MLYKALCLNLPTGRFYLEVHKLFLRQFLSVAHIAISGIKGKKGLIFQSLVTGSVHFVELNSI